MKLLAAVAVIGVTAAAAAAAVAAITIQPSRHDFGEAGVNGLARKIFTISVPPGADSADKLNLSITGANPNDFVANPSTDALDTSCHYLWRYGLRAGPCDIPVHFSPKSIGIKTATLVVTDTRGNRGTAALIGKGVAAICEMRVVSCNYAHLYSGVVRWNSVLRGPTSSTTISVQVDVVNGRASCNGSETIFDAATDPQTQREDIQGDGLIAVEFNASTGYGTGAAVKKGQQVYNITVKCPGAEQQSYEQPAESVGMDLVGSNSYQDGAADPINGVDGTVTVSWSLKRS